MIFNAGYEVGFVTNGWNFIDIYKRMTLIYGLSPESLEISVGGV
jgi:hypothetical protein